MNVFFNKISEQALEDITLDDIDINSIDKELDNDTNSLSSSISVGLSSGIILLYLGQYWRYFLQNFMQLCSSEPILFIATCIQKTKFSCCFVFKTYFSRNLCTLSKYNISLL